MGEWDSELDLELKKNQKISNRQFIKSSLFIDIELTWRFGPASQRQREA